MMRMSVAAALVLAAGSAASAQLRVANWNVSTYTGGRTAEFQTAIYGTFQGRQFAPDVLICQEFVSAAAVTTFLSILNGAPGSPGDWSAAPFFNGNDTDNAFFYRASKVQFLGAAVISAGASGLSNHPRDVTRYDIRPAGYQAVSTTLACYSTHMKAGSTQDDQDQRLIEANAIRDNSESLAAGWNYLLSGDFNIQSSNQAAYQALLSASPPAGRFVDPINTPGSWNNSSSYRFVHTQSPGGSDPNQTGGMDDRFDFVLLSPSLVDGQGFDYIGNPAIPYSTTTWNDPNHSYRCWGNDGTSFNQILTITANAMVGAAIAQALHDAPGADASGGHLPVYLHLRVPGKVASAKSINFGQVEQNSNQQRTLNVNNGGNVGVWTAAGIANLSYSLTASAGFGAPGGSFVAAPGGVGNNHAITMSTASLGVFNGTVSIASNDPDQPVKVVQVTGEVVSTACYANCDQSTGAPLLTANDFTCFVNAYATGFASANCDGSTGSPVLTANDFACFINLYALGCT